MMGQSSAAVESTALLEEGRKLFKLRRELGMTQDDMAGALGISKRTILNWERGYHRPQSPHVEAERNALLAGKVTAVKTSTGKWKLVKTTPPLSSASKDESSRATSKETQAGRRAIASEESELTTDRSGRRLASMQATQPESSDSASMTVSMLSVRVPADVRDHLKIEAVRRKMSVQDLVVQVLRQELGLSEQDDKKKPD